MWVILRALSCGFELRVERYDKYALDTARRYVSLYSWAPMSPTLHKVLLHGGYIAKNSILPVGLLSEDAQEAVNKLVRKYRQDYARKFSRKETN